MGWPDFWTLQGASGKFMSDSVRYELTANGVITPFAEWLAIGCRETLDRFYHSREESA
jgi:hypothetical protein